MIKIEILKKYLGLQVRIRKEEEEKATYDEVLEGVIFKGANLWILGIAMVIACIGLITNSVSAVIGAMLISPLMGPVVGFAFGLAINDRQLKIQGIKNWIIMTLVCLLSATLFFIINPFDNSTEMLETFKKASIFDIFLAFFGGMAGFIGIVKKDGTKIIAGVAVATACIPPLCTAAYGIAHLDYKFFIGGFYFYVINSLFIGWATYLLTKRLQFNHLKVAKLSNRSVVFWDILLVVMLIPGVYIAWQKWMIEENKPAGLTDKQKIELLEKRVNQLELDKTKN
jgi:uncharacterized hydrophobic protein (TIGR00271 family)